MSKCCIYAVLLYFSCWVLPSLGMSPHHCLFRTFPYFTITKAPELMVTDRQLLAREQQKMAAKKCVQIKLQNETANE